MTEQQPPFAPQASPAPKASGRVAPTYVRQQTGHSLVKHIFLVFVIVGIFTIPYYSISKNHYWHV